MRLTLQIWRQPSRDATGRFETHDVRDVERMDGEGFGGCTWHGECQETCPKRISIHTIARMNRDYLTSMFDVGHDRRGRDDGSSGAG